MRVLTCLNFVDCIEARKVKSTDELISFTTVDKPYKRVVRELRYRLSCVLFVKTLRFKIYGSIEFRMQMFVTNILVLCGRAKNLENSLSLQNQHRES
jgi:hypothetical protein